MLRRTMDDTIVPHRHGVHRYPSGRTPRVLDRRVRFRGCTPLATTFLLNCRSPKTVMDGARFFVATLRDTTQQKAAADNLLRTRASLKAIFDNAPAELYSRRLYRHRLMANHCALDFHGMTSADLPHLTGGTCDTGAGTEVSRQAPRELLATRHPVTGEYHHQAGGRGVVILNTMFPLHNAKREIDRIGGLSTDITDLHNTRNQLPQVQTNLHQSEKLAGIAHPLNKPLAVMPGRDLAGTADRHPA